MNNQDGLILDSVNPILNLGGVVPNILFLHPRSMDND